MKTLALLGASGHGMVVADAALEAGWGSVAFFDDAWPRLSSNGNWPVLGDTRSLLAHLDDFDGVLVSIGGCDTRWRKHQELKAAGARLVAVIHPRASVSRFARLSVGTVAMAGSVIQTDAKIGEACIVNTGATVDHDCVLAHGVHVSPGASVAGDVHIGPCSWIGTGAVVRQGTRIGASAVVGAGAVVLLPIPDSTTVVGNPARAMARAPN